MRRILVIVVMLIAMIGAGISTSDAQDGRCPIDNCQYPTFGYGESWISMQAALDAACYQARNTCSSLGGTFGPCVQTNNSAGWPNYWTGAKVCCRVCQ
jgi:hypothetical protein